MSNYQASYCIQGDDQASTCASYGNDDNPDKWSNSAQRSSSSPPKKSKKDGRKGKTSRGKITRSEADFMGIGAQFHGSGSSATK
ncbi:hypothetical protein JX266_001480 [Neoarthrinium moseri]|uniref:uncharacterized protein n=1 Tax=Neoarthrinium moseri TaxID=1658444 RepID=UPI001FDB04DC|nr:uncharacterized protein JN550_008639 [Neoarthrinium moseri]KAI1853496.1 hypothetical protein JX266_001480 [Neoarthrinium moseri]KAI1864819.1 hypothetical protein JN550_008639 [Neoarthrinium moseri]